MAKRVSQLFFLLLMITSLTISTTKAAAQSPDQVVNEQQAFVMANENRDQVARAAALKRFIKDFPDSQFVKIAQFVLVEALIKIGASTTEILTAGDIALTANKNSSSQSLLYAWLAGELAERNEQIEKAYDYALKAEENYRILAATVNKERVSKVREQVQDAIGLTQLRRGDTSKSIETLKAIAAQALSNQQILWHLGNAYEKANRIDEALDSYIASISVFGGTQKRDETALQALYQKRFGSMKGLDERQEAARIKSRQQIALDSHRDERPAPQWILKDLDGKTVKLTDFKGKIVVMDFWGSWCPPCRAELPHFQAMFEKYKDKEIVFLGMNWEQPDDPEDRFKAVSEFIAKNRFTFPVILDHERLAVEAYNIPGFPTVFLVDKNGMIKYKNVGFEENLVKIIEAQIESLTN